MTDKPDGKRWGWWTVAWIFIALPLLYVFSMGPTAFFISRGLVSNDFNTSSAGYAIFVFYYPINYTANKVPAIRSAQMWYCNLWTGAAKK